MHGQYEEITGKEEEENTTAFSTRLSLMRAFQNIHNNNSQYEKVTVL
jgi:hypothetical protein